MNDEVINPYPIKWFLNQSLKLQKILNTINVVGQVGEVQSQGELDLEPVRLVEVWSEFVFSFFNLFLGVGKQKADGLTQLPKQRKEKSFDEIINKF
jgi:hypothetical protein